MSGVRLLEVAAQAEMLRLRQEARRMARMAALLAAAAVFGLFALALLHAAAWVTLANHVGPVAAALWVMAADAVVMVVLLVFSRRRPGPTELEALRIRRMALQEFRAGSLLGALLRLVRRRHPAHEAGGLLAESLLRAFGRR